MNDTTFLTSDPAFRSSNFYTYLEALMPRASQNLQKHIAKESLANHLNLLFCIPDLFFDYSECLRDQQRYCEEFALEFSDGNAESEFLYVYLESDLKPHWVFQIEQELSAGEAIDVRLDFTMTEMHSCEVFSLTDANGDDFALDINSSLWVNAAAAYKAISTQTVHM